MTATGSVYKLRDIYNTNFFYISFKKDLRYLISGIKASREGKRDTVNNASELLTQLYDDAAAGKEITIDLARNKFTPDLHGVLNEMREAGIHLIDSEDKVRECILRQNDERMENRKIPTVEIPEYNPDIRMTDYIRNLDPNVVYHFGIWQNRDIQVCMSILITLSRPAIQMNFGSMLDTILNEVGEKFTMEELEEYHEFYHVTDFGVIVVKRNGDAVYTQQEGEVSISEALKYGVLVPTVFGRKKLTHKSPWEHILGRCVDIVNEYKYQRKTTLKELFGGAQ